MLFFYYRCCVLFIIIFLTDELVLVYCYKESDIVRYLALLINHSCPSILYPRQFSLHCVSVLFLPTLSRQPSTHPNISLTPPPLPHTHSKAPPVTLLYSCTRIFFSNTRLAPAFFAVMCATSRHQ